MNITPKVRRKLFGAFEAFGVAIGAVQVGYVAAGHEQPTPLVVSIAVFAFLSGRLHGIARVRVDDTVTEPLPNTVDTDTGTD